MVGIRSYSPCPNISGLYGLQVAGLAHMSLGVLWGRIPRGSYLFAAEFNPVFLERDKSPIQRRVSKIPPRRVVLAS